MRVKSFVVGQRVTVYRKVPAVVERYFAKAKLYQVRFDTPYERKPGGPAFISCLVSVQQIARVRKRKAVPEGVAHA